IQSISGRHYSIQYTQSGQHSIACGCKLPEDHMTGLFAPDGCILANHLFQDILVTYTRPEKSNSIPFQSFLETKIRHNCCDNRFTQCSCCLQVSCTYQKHGVAINRTTCCGNTDAAI